MYLFLRKEAMSTIDNLFECLRTAVVFWTGSDPAWYRLA